MIEHTSRLHSKRPIVEVSINGSLLKGECPRSILDFQDRRSIFNIGDKNGFTFSRKIGEIPDGHEIRNEFIDSMIWQRDSDLDDGEKYSSDMFLSIMKYVYSNWTEDVESIFESLYDTFLKNKDDTFAFIMFMDAIHSRFSRKMKMNERFLLKITDNLVQLASNGDNTANEVIWNYLDEYEPGFDRNVLKRFIAVDDNRVRSHSIFSMFHVFLIECANESCHVDIDRKISEEMQFLSNKDFVDDIIDTIDFLMGPLDEKFDCDTDRLYYTIQTIKNNVGGRIAEKLDRWLSIVNETRIR